MKNSILNEVYLIKINTVEYKLIFPVKETLPPNIKSLSNKDTQEAVLELFEYDCGWWIATCEKNEIKIKEIELILPPFSEYLDLEKRLKNRFKEEVLMTITIGSTILIPDFDIKRNIPYIHEQLRQASKRNTDLN